MVCSEDNEKVFLVPLNQLPSPLSRKLTDLDSNMQDILKRDDLSESGKGTLYAQTLEKYLNFQQQLQQPIKVPLLERNVSPAGNTPQPNIDLALVPAKLRPKADILVRFIKDNTDLSWTNKGELISKGNVIHDSH